MTRGGGRRRMSSRALKFEAIELMLDVDKDLE